MKWIKITIFFMTLFMSIFFMASTSLKVNATNNVKGTISDLVSILDEIAYGVARAEITFPNDYDIIDRRTCFILLDQPSEFNEENISGFYIFDVQDDIHYFEPIVQNVLESWAENWFLYDFGFVLNDMYPLINYNGFVYWNFEERYWQIDIYDLPYKDWLISQMEKEISNLEDELRGLQTQLANLSNLLYLRNVEIQTLYGEINTLSNEIQYLQNALESEYDRGYSDGVLATESEAYDQGFKDGQNSKLAQNNEAFYQGIEKWLVPAIITVIALGGFVTIAARKRREE